jgi:recombinational DNA repair protein (RecF pathway)
MNEEFISEAIVLDNDLFDDLDIKVFLLTPELGKIICSVKSARKITSKLRGHIEPGNLAIVRIVLGRKNNFKLVDAFKLKKLNLNTSNLHLLNKLLVELAPEKTLYYQLKNEKFNWLEIFKILGWYSKESRCFVCGLKQIYAFHINSQDFACNKCSLRFKKNELIYL